MSPRKYEMTHRATAVAQTRRRIVEACYEEHADHGIAGASLERIAGRAGVGIGTVYRHFPAYEELVMACGAITFERLALPTEEQVREIFSGRISKRHRIERLVNETFGFYARGPEAIRNVREECALLPHLLDEPNRMIEAALDMLTRIALAPYDLTPRQLATVRALLDFDSWRALRRREIKDDAAVTAAAEVLEAWLGRRQTTVR